MEDLTQRITPEYQPYGDDWKKEIMKMRKKDIIELWAKSMQHKNICRNGSLEECENFVRSCMNDFINGVSDQYEFMKQMGEYTMRLHDIFWKGAKENIRKNPELLNQP